MKKIQLIILMCLCAISSFAQVTIGSGLTPNRGTLLDIKEHEASANNVTASRGFMLPRVQLNEEDQLSFGSFSIKDTDRDGDQNKKHIGLMVYNITTDKPFCKGVYIWNGTTWHSVSPCNNSENNIQITPTPSNIYYVASGQDAQTIKGIPLTLTWGSAASTVGVDNVAYDPRFEKLEFVTIDPSVFTNYEGTNVILQAQPMTYAEVNTVAMGGNPFKTKESNYYFVETKKNGKQYKTEPIHVNQTNKALLLDNKYDSPLISLLGTTASNTNKQHTITSNAQWKVKEIYPVGNSAFSNVKINNGTTISSFPSAEIGTELSNGDPAPAVTLSYTATQNASLPSYSRLTLSDANPTSRFYDVVISIYQCGTARSTSVQQPTMIEWAAIAGYRGVLDKTEWLKLSTAALRADADSKSRINTPDPTSGIAWHRDQDGNVFLSGSFIQNAPTSNARRWMITNLTATTFAPSPRSDGKSPASSPNFTFANFGTANIGYPNNSSGTGSQDKTLYNSNPRSGLLYNWAAATMNRSSSANETEGTTNVQGICPNGWHLPSDSEMTTLEQEITTYTATYSSMANIGGQAVGSYATYRGVHSLAMEDPCQYAPGSTTTQGKGNAISSGKRAGFNILNLGYAYDSKYYAYGLYGTLWTASSSSPTNAWARYVISNQVYVNHASMLKATLANVRCVMDNK